MRISLLLQREPFGSIFEQTVTSFLEKRVNKPITVQWINGRPKIDRIKSELHNQVWLCNTYLNAIFAKTAKDHIFEPIYREFSRSTQWWKRPLQRLYVDAAVAPGTRAYLAQATVTFSPSLPNAEYCLFIGGNHKIRLIDTESGAVYGILKTGFPSRLIEREITVRQYVAELKLPVPRLIDVAPDGTWFREAYIIGTPLNRLSSKVEQKRAITEAFNALQRLWETTTEEVDTVDFASQLRMRVEQSANAISALDPNRQKNLQRTCDQLLLRIERLASEQPRILTTLTHGDCQSANILVNHENIWLIDWEYADQRMAGYDELVFTLQARSPVGIARRLADWITNGTLMGLRGTLWARHNGSRAERELRAAMFLLEELALHAAENANPQFVRVGSGLITIQNEVNMWIEDTARR